MRVLLALLLLALFAGGAQAQFRVAARGCVEPGETITISGPFNGQQVGQIVLGTQPPTTLRVRSWTNRRVRATVPGNVTATGVVPVIWIGPSNTFAASVVGQQAVLGQVTLCLGGRGLTGPRNPVRAARDVVPAPDGSPEYVVSVASNQANAAVNALQFRGAQLLRSRPLPRLGRTLLFFAFPGNLSLGQARSILSGAAPSAQVDVHNIYGFAEGPRLYAATLIGDVPGRTCALGRAVPVGVIDGPVNARHPALSGVSVAQVSMLTGGERPVSADHGTAVAGLIAGSGGGSFQGFASGARIYAVTAFSRGRAGEGARLENIAAGLDWLAGQGVRIVNLSMEGSPNAAFEDVMARARGAGLVMIAAAGNEGTSAPRYPAASPSTIAVTAVDAAGRAYGRANTGPHIEFAAPGVDLYVARGGGGGYRSGTSYAAPIVTAIVARAAARGGISLDGARGVLRRGVRDLGAGGRDTQYGYGLVQTGGC